MVENSSIEQYISSRRQVGVTDSQIRSELEASGWDSTTISVSLSQQNVTSPTQEKNTYPNTSKKILVPLLVFILVAAVLGWYFLQNSLNGSNAETNQVTSTPNTITNSENSFESNEDTDSYQSVSREESTNKMPYVAAASDVKQIINAVYRYKAFQGTHPTSLQDMVDKKELTQEFVDRKQLAYTITFSATGMDDCKVIVNFSDGRVITSMCEDPNYHDQFTEFYDN